MAIKLAYSLNFAIFLTLHYHFIIYLNMTNPPSP